MSKKVKLNEVAINLDFDWTRFYEEETINQYNSKRVTG
jgi:hypothetical protein